MIDIQQDQAESLWKSCLNYLKNKADLEDVLDLASDKTNPLLSDMAAIYLKLLQSLSNRQGMPKSIGDVRRLSEVLCGFIPYDVVLQYEDNWQKLFDKIMKNVKPASRMDISVPQNYWVVFCKGSIDAANFLSKFNDGKEFISSIRQFAESELFVAGLPKVLEMEITGLGFPLACDFLKEAGWPQYAKADTHTKKLLKAVGLSDGSDYGTFKAMLQIARYIDETPYRVDKVLWLIGSGKLYNKNLKIASSREEFLDYYRQVV